MKNKAAKIIAGLCVVGAAILCALPSTAQMAEVKEKPRMYSYVGFWNIPRAQWAEMEKSRSTDLPILQKAMSSGMLVGYGDDTNLLHEPDGSTHDDWWTSMSMAGLLNVLDEFYKSGGSTTPVLGSATKHWDNIFVSQYYNYHSGSWQGVYSAASAYKLKADAPEDAVDMISKGLVVPIMEKLLADGTLHEYEIDTEAVHSDPPGMFWIVYIAASADGIDKVQQAIRDAVKANPMGAQAFGSMVDWNAHRDYLSRTNATYK